MRLRDVPDGFEVKKLTGIKPYTVKHSITIYTENPHSKLRQPIAAEADCVFLVSDGRISMVDGNKKVVVSLSPDMVINMIHEGDLT